MDYLSPSVSHWVDTSERGLFVPECIIRPVVSASLIFPWCEQGQYIIYFENQEEQSLLNTVDSKDGINLPCLKGKHERTIILRGNKST